MFIIQAQQLLVSYKNKHTKLFLNQIHYCGFNVGRIFDLLQKQNLDPTGIIPREDIVFQVEETLDRASKTTYVRFSGKLGSVLRNNTYETTISLSNEIGQSETVQVKLVKDAFFDQWSDWSTCSRSCISEVKPNLGEPSLTRK